MRKYLIYTVTVVLSTFVSSAQPKVEFTEWQNPEINQNNKKKKEKSR